MPTKVIIENAITLAAFTCVAIFAPDAWKLLSILTLLNLTYPDNKP